MLSIRAFAAFLAISFRYAYRPRSAPHSIFIEAPVLSLPCYADLWLPIFIGFILHNDGNVGLRVLSLFWTL